MAIHSCSGIGVLVDLVMMPSMRLALWASSATLGFWHIVEVAVHARQWPDLIF